VSGCCDPRGCNDIFGPRFARHLASRYRKRGLDKTAARMVSYLADRGVDGASVLEIGGGVGDIQLELPGRGASRATNLELVDAYDTDASDLAEQAWDARPDDSPSGRHCGHAGPSRGARHCCAAPGGACYPDHERLLTAAADHAKSCCTVRPRARSRSKMSSSLRAHWA
jgi:hypothetical protein